MTSPLSSQVTEPVHQQPDAYTSAPARDAAHTQANASRGGSSWLRYLPLILIGILGLAVLGGYLLARLTRPAVVTVSEKTQAPSAPVKAQPNRPSRPDAAVMSEEGANVTDEKTTIKSTYPLGENASVSLVNVTGNIKIEGWDEPQAEVKVIKEGGSVQDRQAVEIKLANRTDLLSLETSPTRSSPVEVHYELRLPRNVRRLEIKSADSEVELSKMTGAINVSLQGSSIELKDVAGAINTKIVQGDTKVAVKGGLSGAQAFKSVNGDIELRLEDNTGADISAETVDGEIEADDDLRLKVESKRVGQSATGRIGGGGATISIKTVNGDIRIKK
jgi:Putative adhesin